MPSPFSYTLTCPALAGMAPGQTIKITHWCGTEAVSRPYRFVITFAVQQANLPLEKLLNTPATLSGYRPDGQPLQWHGIVTQGTQQGSDETYDYYQIVLEPRLARLRHITWSDIYLNQQLDDLILQLLRLADLQAPYSGPSAPYDYRIAANQLAATRTVFTCQFEETCLDFLMRKLEYYGVYFWFEQGQDQESVVFANDVQQQPTDADDVVYYPRGLIDPDAQEIAVTRLSRQVSLQPTSVTLHSSNDLSNTTMSLISQASVPAPVQGFGEVHSAADYFEELQGGNSIAGETFATWRGEELACQRLRIDGEARTPGIVAGRMISVSESLRGANTMQYYVIEVTHEGSQTLETAPATDAPAYLARFTALPRWLSDDSTGQPLQFRPPRITPIPVISRLVNGFVDIETPSQAKQFAQPDEYGRYRVRLMFPHQRYDGYQNSAWLRLATPYAGGSASPGLSSAGMHFPLREGTEVIVSFLNGNPDRPVILAALPNVEAPSVVTASNAADHVIQTPAGNVLALRDSGGGGGNGNSKSSSNGSGGGTGSSSGGGNTSGSGSNAPDSGSNYVVENTASVVVASSAYESSLTLGNVPPSSEFSAGFILSTDNSGTIQAEKSMLIEVPGHLHISAGGGSMVNNYLHSEIPGLPKGITAETSGGIAIEHFLGAKFSATEAIDVSSFMGVKADLCAALAFSFKAAGALEITYAGAKEIHLREKQEITDTLTKMGRVLTLIFEKWDLVALERKETLGSSSTLVMGSHTVEAGTVYKACVDAGISSLTMKGSVATLQSVNTIISATSALELLSNVVAVTAGTELNMSATALTAQAETIDLISEGNISLVGTETVTCTAPLIMLG